MIRKLGRTGRKRRRQRQRGLKTDGTFGAVLDKKHILLMKWAKRNGVDFGMVKPAVFPNTGRGLMACKKLKKNDCIISVPERLLITTRTVQQSKVARVLIHCKSQLNARQMLCIFLLYEKYQGETSFWYPYISTLPEIFSTPCYFGEHELGVLPESYFKLCKDQIDVVTKEHQEIVQLLGVNLYDLASQTEKAFELEDYKWAWCVVNTRSVYMPKFGKKDNITLGKDMRSRGEEKNYALAPVLDMLNHTDTAEVQARLNPANGRYEIHTITEYCKGTQVFINYGPHDNRTLLLEYGFVLPSNIHNAVTINPKSVYALATDFHPVAMEKKLDIIQRNRLDKDFSVSKECGVSWSLTVTLRILAMDRTELVQWQTALSGRPISENNERKILEWTQVLLEQTLLLYRMSIADEGMTKHEICSDNLRLAVELLLQEKYVLQQALRSTKL